MEAYEIIEAERQIRSCVRYMKGCSANIIACEYSFTSQDSSRQVFDSFEGLYDFVIAYHAGYRAGKKYK